MKITVFGGSGFVGRELVAKLLAAGHAVRVVSRRPQGEWPGVEVQVGAVEDDATLRAALQGQDLAINLIGILHGDAARFAAVHSALPQRIAAMCVQLGVSRLLHMSALHAAEDAPSLYLQSKGRGENAVHAYAKQGLQVVSFRPSVIFGAQDSFINRFAALLKWSPGIMLLPGATARFAPVYVGDVAQVFVNALEGESGQRLDLCGPRDYSLLELVRLTAQWSGQPRLILPMPPLMAQLAARAFELLPNPPLTRDNLASMRVDSVCPTGCARQPTALEDVAPHYLAAGG